MHMLVQNSKFGLLYNYYIKSCCVLTGPGEEYAQLIVEISQHENTVENQAQDVENVEKFVEKEVEDKAVEYVEDGFECKDVDNDNIEKDDECKGVECKGVDCKGVECEDLECKEDKNVENKDNNGANSNKTEKCKTTKKSRPIHTMNEASIEDFQEIVTRYIVIVQPSDRQMTTAQIPDTNVVDSPVVVRRKNRLVRMCRFVRKRFTGCIRPQTSE